MRATDLCADRFVLVVGLSETLDRATHDLERAGYQVVQFGAAADALPWLYEETPCGALAEGPPDRSLVAELEARDIPLLLLREGLNPVAALAA